MKTRKIKLMLMMTVVALSVFSTGTIMAADEDDFYPQPVNDSWQDANTKGAYASFTNGNDYVNVYKYAVNDNNAKIETCNETYEACYQTIYSEGNDLYLVVGYAKEKEDISKVRQMVEYISYPGNPSLTTMEIEDNSSVQAESGKTLNGSGPSTESQKNPEISSDSANSEILSTTTLTLYDNSGNPVSVQKTIFQNYDCEYVDGNGMNYTTDDETIFTDENGNVYQALNDSTHYQGAELEQHVLEDEDGNSVTVTQSTNGDYYFYDENGTGYSDNGDGSWRDENGNSYTEIN